MSAILHPGYAFDAAAILGIGTPYTEPLPAPEPGYTIIRIPEGLSLLALRESAIGKRMMWPWDWYDKYQWSREALPAGTYRLRLPVPDSNRKTGGEQQAMLPPGEQLAPAALVLAALLCTHLQGGPDPLGDDWTRCAEQTASGYRVALTWRVGRVGVVNSRDGGRNGLVWAASSCRTS